MTSRSGQQLFDPGDLLTVDDALGYCQNHLGLLIVLEHLIAPSLTDESIIQRFR